MKIAHKPSNSSDKKFELDDSENYSSEISIDHEEHSESPTEDQSSAPSKSMRKPLTFKLDLSNCNSVEEQKYNHQLHSIYCDIFSQNEETAFNSSKTESFNLVYSTC